MLAQLQHINKRHENTIKDWSKATGQTKEAKPKGGRRDSFLARMSKQGSQKIKDFQETVRARVCARERERVGLGCGRGLWLLGAGRGFRVPRALHVRV